MMEGGGGGGGGGLVACSYVQLYQPTQTVIISQRQCGTCKRGTGSATSGRFQSSSPWGAPIGQEDEIWSLRLHVHRMYVVAITT